MPEEHPREDPKKQDPNITTTTFLRRGAIGGKVIFLGVGIAFVAVSLGDPERVLLMAIGCTLVGYSGDLLIGWGALRNYGTLYELVSRLFELIAELRAERRHQYLDSVGRLAEIRDTLTETMDALTRQLGEIRDMLQPVDEVGQHRQHGSD